MELVYVKEFIRLVQYGNYQDAAEALYLSTSALSKHIKKIEEELSAELFTDNRKRLTLTPIGKTYLTYALQLAEIDNEAMAAVAQIKRKSNEVIIGYSCDALLYPRLMTAFTSNFSSNVRMIESDNYSILEKIYMNHLDYGAICELERNISQDNRFKRLPLIKDEVIMVMPRTHAMAGRDVISVKDFENDTFINFKFPSVLSEFESIICKENGILPNYKRLETRKLLMLLMGIIKNGDVALLPKTLIERFVRENPACNDELCISKVEGDYTFSVNLVYMNDKANIVPAISKNAPV